jgi:hypothetical protein
MAGCPCEVVPDCVIHPNPAGRVVAAADLRVEIIQAWPEQGEDVEGPVKPSSHLLPVLELVVRFCAVRGLDCPGVEGVAQVVTFFPGQGERHGIGVHVNADNGDNSTEDLFFGFVGDRQFIPEPEEDGLGAGVVCRVRFIE